MFSFGAVLDEMVTGRRAFAGKSRAVTLAAVVREQPKAPSAVVAGVPTELDHVILRCLQKDPGRRFQHMAEEIWLADRDRSNPTQTTRGPGIWQGSPHWSPDGRRIAFDAKDKGGHVDIWTIDADGGSPSRLTSDPGDEVLPSWSRGFTPKASYHAFMLPTTPFCVEGGAV